MSWPLYDGYFQKYFLIESVKRGLVIDCSAFLRPQSRNMFLRVTGRGWQGARQVLPIPVPAACLYFICKALEKDCRYSKGLVLKEKIFEEQPCLRKDSLRMFLKW